VPAKAYCRENPDRAIWINAPIDQALVNSLTPQILKLRKQSDEPITVYIDSDGGYTTLSETLYNLLEAPDADGRRCPIVTVVTGIAASAAADFLACGHYVIAYPHATVYFHGTRREAKRLTMESAETTAKLLRSANEMAAMDLAGSIVGRSIFIYTTLEGVFEEIRKENPGLTDVECFSRALHLRLSSRADALPINALSRYNEVQELSDVVFGKIKVAAGDHPTKTERSILKAIIDYEYRNIKTDPDWSFTDDNIDRIVQDFRIIKDFHVGAHTAILEPLAKKFGKFFLSDEDKKTFKTTTFTDNDEREKWLQQRAEPKLQPLWYFIVSVCRLLQQKENPLTGLDAYWLGIVNEVVGNNLPSLRQVVEWEKAPSKPTPESGPPTASTQPT
jgi:ATP-dependent protease ClpP protease subunit